VFSSSGLVAHCSQDIPLAKTEIIRVCAIKLIDPIDAHRTLATRASNRSCRVG